jgi:TRAP transporter 4TM/12TM fusion protein
VVTTGTITIPLMKRHGFLPHEAGAIATAAGTGGAIMPPVMGAGIFMMAEITGIPLITILTYSILPALLYFGSIYVYIHVKASKRGMVPMRTSEAIPGFWRTFWRGAHLLAPLAVLLYLMYRDYSPFYASAACVVTLLAVSYLRRESRLGWRDLLAVLEITTREALVLSATSAIAAVILGIITLSGMMLKITSLTLLLAKGSLIAGILLIALISTIVGLGLPVTSAYIIVATLGAPSLTELGMTLLAAHLLIFWFSQTATVTPPVAMTAFVAAQIAEAPMMRTAWESMWVAAGLYLVPLMFAYTNILSGDWLPMLADAAAGMFWLAMLPIIAEGWLRAPLGPAGRAVIALAAVCFFAAAFNRDLLLTLSWMAAGLTVVGVLAIYQGQFVRARREQPSAYV